jgi:hypothetical protein
MNERKRLYLAASLLGIASMGFSALQYWAIAALSLAMACYAAGRADGLKKS